MIEVSALLAGMGEAAVTETAVETAVVASEIDSVKNLMTLLEGATVPIPEAVSGVETASSATHPSLKNILAQTLTKGTRSEFTMEVLDLLESSELAEEAELAEELSEYNNLNNLMSEATMPQVGQSLIHPMRGSYSAQLSRLSERVTGALRDAALRRNAEAAVIDDAVKAEELKEQAKLLDELSDITDEASDYLGAVSYPEFMVRHSPGNQ